MHGPHLSVYFTDWMQTADTYIDNKNQNDKLEAWELLKKIKEYQAINSKIVFTEENLPVLSANEIRELENQLKLLNIKEWKCFSKGGEEILLTFEPLENKQSNVINFTFLELFALKLAIEILDLQEIEIVRKNN
jgi:hypothetical protein